MQEKRAQLDKEDFATLWNITRSWQVDPIKASDGTPEDIERYNQIFLKLDKLGYIKIEMRDGEIYGAMAKEKGKKILDDEKFKDLVIELDL